MLEIATSMLSEIAGALVIVGIPVILAAWFAGPSRWATRARRTIAPLMASTFCRRMVPSPPFSS